MASAFGGIAAKAPSINTATKPLIKNLRITLASSPITVPRPKRYSAAALESDSKCSSCVGNCSGNRIDRPYLYLVVTFFIDQ